MAYRNGIKRLLVIVIVVIAAGVAFFVSSQRRLLTPTTVQLQNAFPNETWQVLEHSTQFTLFSLEPRASLVEGKNKTVTFHGYLVLGQLQVTNPHQKQELLRALGDGVSRSKVLDSCFSPRHGIHAVAGNKSVDLVICFHCQQFELYWGANEKLSGIADVPQGTFDRVLSDAGITLAKQ